ncbi:MAG TPA: VOC family protein [Blastocatellia bacterium]
MTEKTHYKPQPFHTATPYMIFKDAGKAIEFYQKAFGAKELMRTTDPTGRISHAEIQIGDSPIMLSTENPKFPGGLSAESRGGSPVHIYLYVEDVDALFKQAIAAGATELSPVEDQFYGDRSGGVTDPFGHVWYIATHKEDVSDEEIQRRSAQGGH